MSSPSATEVDATLKELEPRVTELSKRVFGDDVKKQVEEIIAKIPAVDTQGLDASRRARLLILRARAQLVMPAYNKDAEADLAKALKLRPTDVPAWIAMSECMWKRQALKEAEDALNSALGMDARSVPALCQLSRILRAKCNVEGTAPETRADLMQQSVVKAKEAVGIDMNSGEAWAALGVALIQQTVAMGMDLTLLRKAHQALAQASRRSEADPDIHYNHGVVRRCLGDFGGAAADFKRAYELDPKGLSVAKREAEAATALLQGFHGVLQSFAAEGGDSKRARDFRKTLQKMPLIADGGKEVLPVKRVQSLMPSAGDKTLWTAVRIVELVSAPSDQPLCYMAVDRDCTFCALLVYRTLPAAFKSGDTVFVSCPPCGITDHTHSFVPRRSQDEAAAASETTTTMTLPAITAEPTALFVNGVPISKNLFKNPLMATRQFV